MLRLIHLQRKHCFGTCCCVSCSVTHTSAQPKKWCLTKLFTPCSRQAFVIPDTLLWLCFSHFTVHSPVAHSFLTCDPSSYRGVKLLFTSCCRVKQLLTLCCWKLVFWHLVVDVYKTNPALEIQAKTKIPGFELNSQERALWHLFSCFCLSLWHKNAFVARRDTTILVLHVQTFWTAIRTVASDLLCTTVSQIKGFFGLQLLLSNKTRYFAKLAFNLHHNWNGTEI